MLVRVFIQIGAAMAAICLFASSGFAQTAPRPTNLQIGKRAAGREIKLPKYEKWAKYDEYLPMNIERFCDFFSLGI